MNLLRRKVYQLQNEYYESLRFLGKQRNSIKRNNCGRRILSRNFYAETGSISKVTFNLPFIGKYVNKAIVNQWFVKVGDKVSQYDNICQLSVENASITITSRYNGIITKLHYEVEDTAYLGKPLVDMTVNEGTEEDIEEETKTVEDPSKIKFNKEFHEIGETLKGDIIKFPVKNSFVINEDRIEPIEGLTKWMAKDMTEYLKIPHFVYQDEIRVTKLSDLIKSVKSLPELGEIKLSLLAFLIKATSNSLQRYPILNASIDEECKNINYRKDHDITIPMDTKAGLVTPVIKSVQNLGVMEIAAEIKRLLKSGKECTFLLNDLTSGTIMISNIGSIGCTYAKPIIMPNQVVEMVIGASQLVPKFNEERQITAQEIICISIAADHRILDGATVGRFTNFLKRQIENPYLLFLNL